MENLTARIAVESFPQNSNGFVEPLFCPQNPAQPARDKLALRVALKRPVQRAKGPIGVLQDFAERRLLIEEMVIIGKALQSSSQYILRPFYSLTKSLL